MRVRLVGIALACIAYMAPAGFAQAPDIIDDSALASATSKTVHVTPFNITNGQAHARFGIFGIDSIPNFNLQFFANGIDPFGNPNRHWYTNTVGNPPQMGGTTMINAPLQPVNVELDDVNGNLRVISRHPLVSTATPFFGPVLNSPIFSNAVYSSGPTPTQFVDAVQRAQFFNHPMQPDWHTLLNPQPLAPLTVHIRQSSTCAGGFTGCYYYAVLNADGTCCRYILIDFDLFFDTLAEVVITDIAGNAITTHDISSFLFPNTFLYFTDRRDCCVFGFHTYFADPSSDLERRWVVNYSSWMTPGLIDPWSDVSVLSHEVGEIVNDPFVASDDVHNVVPWWLAPNGECGTLVEVGDVIEGLPNAAFPMTMNGFTYHPQNLALLQWFQVEMPSDALGGAYSYPDTTVLRQPSAPQQPFCTP
jgi:hypothetical protein